MWLLGKRVQRLLPRDVEPLILGKVPCSKVYFNAISSNLAPVFIFLRLDIDVDLLRDYARVVKIVTAKHL